MFKTIGCSTFNELNVMPGLLLVGFDLVILSKKCGWF